VEAGDGETRAMLETRSVVDALRSEIQSEVLKLLRGNAPRTKLARRWMRP